MSRSLRSRPLTLYDASTSSYQNVGGGGGGGQGSGDHPSVPSRSTSNHPSSKQHRDDPRAQHQQQGSSSSSKSKLKKASQVGSNLKKRLSTRYADDDRRSSRMAAMGADVLSHMPAPVNAGQYQPQQQQQQQPSSYDQYFYQYSSQPYPEQEEADQEADIIEADEAAAAAAAANALSSSTSIPAMPPPHSTAPSSSRHRLEPPSSTTRHGVASSSSSHSHTSAGAPSTSSRKPTLAWPGSSLRTLIDTNRASGLPSTLIDLDVLRSPPESFDAISYLRDHLPESVQPSVFSETMGQARVAAQQDVKAQIFDHYADFIAVSSQVGALENEVIELKSLLAEWRQMPRLLERHDESAGRSSSSLLAATAAASTTAAGSKRTSLQQVYRAQLTALWEGIANSQKLIPYKPGRHLIAEAPDFLELNAATYRPVRNVALFLLDDALLVATRKKARMSTRVKLEAERCFALGEIVVVDLKDSKGRSSSKQAAADTGEAGGGGIKDSIKIKRGKETFVYRAEKPESKRALLNAFRTVAEDLANKKKREKAGVRDEDGSLTVGQPGGMDLRRQSIYAGMAFDHRNPPAAATSNGGSTAMVKSMSSSSSLLEIAEQEEGDQEDEEAAPGVMRLASQRIKTERRDPLRWLNDWSDSLAVDIALRRWADATEKVVKGKAMLSTYSAPTTTGAGPGVDGTMHTILSARLATHTSALVTALLGVLRSPSTLRKTMLVQIAAHLTTLGYSSIARTAFLSTRDESLRRRKRAIKFEGDTELYVSELSLVVFGTVRNTSEWFMAAWKESGLASGFVRWALSQVHGFAVTFRRQVYGGASTGGGGAGEEERERGSVAERARRVAMESAQQLKDVGLDFTFVLEELLKSEEEHNREAEVAVAQQQQQQVAALTPRKRSGSGASSGSAASGSSGVKGFTPASSHRATPPPGASSSSTASSSPQRSKTPGRSGGSVLNRIADLETMASLASTSGATSRGGGGGGGGTAPLSFANKTAFSSPASAPPRPRAHRSASTTSSSSLSRSYEEDDDADGEGGGGMTTAPSSPNTPTQATMAPLRRTRSGSNSSVTSTTSSRTGAGSGAPPVPPLPRNVASPSSSSSGGGGGGAGGAGPVIPSLTLTLADEASGISRRISSAGLPDGMRSAQQIRREAARGGGGGTVGGEKR